ncbi:MAG: hypothetical protein OEW88_10620, partial [Gammaproteobacteria bacterium]|nr:hypothetical protein [Gammaproteobacteria bacterium]
MKELIVHRIASALAAGTAVAFLISVGLSAAIAASSGETAPGATAVAAPLGLPAVPIPANNPMTPARI